MPTVGPESPSIMIFSDLLSRVTYADSAVTVGIPAVVTFKLSGTSTQTPTLTMSDKFEIVDVVCRKDGAGAGNTVQLKNGSTAITDAITFTTDKAVTRAGTIDTAQNVIAAGSALTCTATFAAGTVAGLVTVYGIIRP